jgi:hypothetical protein
MKRSAPLKRSGFTRRAPPVLQERERPVAALLVRPAAPVRAVMARVDAQVRAQPKDEPVRSEAYRRLVAQLPCCNCRREGRSQAAHPNTGKGGATKTDDRRCFPLCADEPGVPGCHMAFDQGALFDKPTRRRRERAWGAETRQHIEQQGLWPAGLARWDELNDHDDEESTP